MRYPPRLYAQALAAVLQKRLPPEKKKGLVKNFLELLRKNGELRSLKKIVLEAERLVLSQEGKRKILLESARPLSRKQKELVRKILRRGDVLEEKISPELVAGVKITVNEELQLDGTLARKLKKMFA